MKLIPIYERLDHVQILWDLLLEREEHQNISHREMPTRHHHEMFVRAPPYDSWCFIDVDGTVVGSIYLTYNLEIGIHIFKSHQGLGYGPRAIRAMMDGHGALRYLANINPANEASKRMWEKLGFTKIQETYASEHRD